MCGGSRKVKTSTTTFTAISEDRGTNDIFNDQHMRTNVSRMKTAMSGRDGSELTPISSAGYIHATTMEDHTVEIDYDRRSLEQSIGTPARTDRSTSPERGEVDIWLSGLHVSHCRATTPATNPQDPPPASHTACTYRNSTRSEQGPNQRSKPEASADQLDLKVSNVYPKLREQSSLTAGDMQARVLLYRSKTPTCVHLTIGGRDKDGMAWQVSYTLGNLL